MKAASVWPVFLAALSSAIFLSPAAQDTVPQGDATPDLVVAGNQAVSAIGSGALALESVPATRGRRRQFPPTGSSMAAPVAAGRLTPGQVKARQMKTPTKSVPSVTIATDPVSQVMYASAYDFLTVGAGYLDINAARNSPELALGPVLSPTTVYDASTRTVSLVSGSSVVRDSIRVWGSSVIWEFSAVCVSSVVWADAFASGGERTSVLGET
ncbi:MAG: hypothetical protein NTW28_21435 [Candidatus Solibacter sp.]|nr:hypothetical protein [Candidatus Solibacter sp.]